MEKQNEFTLWIDPYTPKTIPMGRLAEYMSDLALLLGESESVHFERLDKGSTKLVSRVDHEAFPKVRERVELAKGGDGPPDAIKAIKSINKRLREDNGTGRLLEGKTAEIIMFPGLEAPDEPGFGHVTQHGSLAGEVIRVGGTKESVFVHIQPASGAPYKCRASRSVAKEIAKHLFTGEVRVFGVGRWLRTEHGSWEQEVFQIETFTPLDGKPLSSVLADIRAIQGNEWPEVDDPWALLDQLRNGPGGGH